MRPNRLVDFSKEEQMFEFVRRVTSERARKIFYGRVSADLEWCLVISTQRFREMEDVIFSTVLVSWRIFWGPPRCQTRFYQSL